MRTAFTDRFGLDHPVIQGPFGGGLSTALLTATVSNLGGLGSFGAEPYAPAEIIAHTAEIRARTSRPFNMNLWVSVSDPGGENITDAEFERVWQAFAPYYRELGVEKPAKPRQFHQPFEVQFEALLEAAPPVFSFVFGIPTQDQLARCRKRGILTLGAATSLAEAIALDEAGVDGIVATGAEAGGHRVSFLASAEESLIGTFALIQLAAPRVKAPVVAAGGIADAKGVRAALALGAAGVQVGTGFLACDESGASARHRAALFSREAEHTLLTRTFSGRLSRGLRNRLAVEMPHQVAPYPIQSWFAGQLKAAARKQERSDLISIWSGQIAPNLRHRSARALMTDLTNV